VEYRSEREDGRVAASRSTERSSRGATNRSDRRPIASSPSVQTWAAQNRARWLAAYVSQCDDFRRCDTPQELVAHVDNAQFVPGSGRSAVESAVSPHGPEIAVGDGPDESAIVATPQRFLVIGRSRTAATSSSRDRAAARAAGPLAARRAARAPAGPRASGAEWSATRLPRSGAMSDELAAPTTTAELACVDGRTMPADEATIPATDEGLLRGDGVFEVIRVYDGRPFALVEHLDRLERSAANLRLEEVPRAELEAEIPELLAARGGPEFDGCLRIVLTRGGHRLLLTEPVPRTPERVRLGVVEYAPTRVLDGVKSLSYAGNMLAGKLARERGFDEALLVTPHGRVLEAPTSSIFWVDSDGRLCTPPLDEHILASITRAKVMEVADVTERPCTMDDLRVAREAFLASTTREAQSIAAIEDIELPEGPVTRETAAAVRALIESELGG
jgi:branched-chain amino acid aminotransferase